MADVTTALVTGITSVATEVLSAIGDIVPVAIPIAGAIIIVVVGMRIFKRLAK